MNKVVILHTDFRIYWPARLRSLNDILLNNNFSLDIIEIAGDGSPYSFARKEQQNDLSWHILFPSKKMEDLCSDEISKSVKKKLDQLNPDIIIAGPIAFPSGALSVRWAVNNHKKIIIFDDAKIQDVQRNCFVNFIKQAVYHGVDAMFYPAIQWEETGAFWKFPKNKLFYGLDVVDNEFWERTGYKESTEYSPYFLFVGRQIPEKNILFLLEAYSVYRNKTEKPYNLLLVGDGPEREKIRQFINKNQITGVRLLPFLSQIELAPLMKSAEALILPSHKETWGLVINEALACSIPVFASNKCGAYQSLIHNGRNGYVFSPDNLNQLVDNMIIFHNLTVQERKNMASFSHETIIKWGLDLFSKSLLKAINELNLSSPKKISLLDKLIINIWKGRYRPI